MFRKSLKFAKELSEEAKDDIIAKLDVCFLWTERWTEVKSDLMAFLNRCAGVRLDKESIKLHLSTMRKIYSKEEGWEVSVFVYTYIPLYI
jgi:hypothetical protein